MNRIIILILSVFFSGLFLVGAVVREPAANRSAIHKKATPRSHVPENIFSNNVKELTSSGGIKFWFMRDDSAPLVHIKIAFKNSGACYQERAKAGVPIFYSNAVFCGSVKYSKTQFAEKCSNLSLTIHSTADFDNIYFHLTIPKIVLNEAASIFNALIASPRFENDKVKIIQDEVVSYLQNYAIDSENIA
ncbi:MAG: insulinase family protein, partial [Holosporaceae bacterium]|nr:insulinase family protein [Holosporaceae bacterium]